MIGITALGALGSAGAGSTAGGTKEAATNAFGLSFESLLKIILTQLTYQDPLKPMDNFEFVSQLAQFSQIQQGQTANDQLSSLVSAQSNSQAIGILGGTVDVTVQGVFKTGKVTGVTFDGGSARITILTKENETLSNISTSDITAVRQGS